MPPETRLSSERIALRTRAVRQLRGAGSNANTNACAPDALRALYDLASSPATAANALALLHELQVHQVEVDLQDEELRRTRAEMEISLARQMQLYDAAPVAYLTIEPDTTLREANLMAAEILGLARELLPGRTLESMLLPLSHAVLHGMLARLAHGSDATTQGTLQLGGCERSASILHAAASRDPAGGRFLLALSRSSDILSE